MSLPLSLEPVQIAYLVIGFGLLALTLRPALTRYSWANLPLFYVLLGVGMALAGLPTLDPRLSQVQSAVVEHASELIVIVSLSGVGLAIDSRMTWHNWRAGFRLLLIAMPLTIACVYGLGVTLLGLGAAASMLLAASLAPTDPVLARSVQVGPPGGKETPMQVALTAEAGMNDGLAFPFVYLAITLAGLSAAAGPGDWAWGWLGYDVLYRVVAGWALGWACGMLISRLVFSPWGDARQGAWNSLAVMLSATLLAYGVAETLDAYGFLAVFAAARAGRSNARGTEDDRYHEFAHHGAEQFESILLVLLLLWFGMFVGSGALEGLTWEELAFAVLLIFVIRPLAGLLSLVGDPCDALSRRKVAFFGIRGMGTIFYVAYGLNAADIPHGGIIWRVVALCILLSIVVHGFASSVVVHEGEGGQARP
ncbi:hypothetical protein [Tranquillimonas alkanivorans]|uniref:Sodium/proton antiporter, CPA1 family n=1 Tax=Tranquillimonas alkanivorans TaxID=441119 RepID=A0A1I5QSY8_9RHOB|nr:hypothetical protein [Tranquillimonas alkanivorans]SFP49375.1 sodium/proton antiporter, CPA1 family [Tranquillimonas alkanivorans]